MIQAQTIIQGSGVNGLGPVCSCSTKVGCLPSGLVPATYRAAGPGPVQSRRQEGNRNHETAREYRVESCVTDYRTWRQG